MKKLFSNPAPESPSATQYGARILSYLPHILALLFILAFVAFAWQEPSQTPPQGNAPAPINVSDTDQSKLGGLGLGGGVGQALQWFKNIGGTLYIQNAAGTSSVVIGQDGKVGIGTTAPTQILDANGYVKGRSGLCVGDDCRTAWPVGDITSVNAGTGLTGGGGQGDVTLNLGTTKKETYSTSTGYWYGGSAQCLSGEYICGIQWTHSGWVGYGGGSAIGEIIIQCCGK